MFSNAFPERLGHCILYQPPMIFQPFFSTVNSLGIIDSKTAGKVVFISGNVDEGSKNDLLLKDIIGDEWKDLVGLSSIGASPKGASPGYLHDEYWPAKIKRLQSIHSMRKASDVVESPSSAGGKLPPPLPLPCDDNTNTVM